jgi:hypothetical protein
MGQTGRPLESDIFLERVESLLGRISKPQKGGRLAMEGQNKNATRPGH